MEEMVQLNVPDTLPKRKVHMVLFEWEIN